MLLGSSPLFNANLGLRCCEVKWRSKNMCYFNPSLIVVLELSIEPSIAAGTFYLMDGLENHWREMVRENSMQYLTAACSPGIESPCPLLQP